MIDWVRNTVFGWVGDVSRAVRDFIYGLIANLVSWITDITDWVARLYNGLARWVSDAVAAVWRGIGDVYGWAVGTINRVVSDVTSWVGRLIGDVYGWAVGTINGVIRWAAGIVGDVWRWVTQLPGWVVDNIWRPLANAIDGAYRWVTGSVIPWVHGLVNDVIGWVQGAFGRVWDVLGTAWGWIARWGTVVVDFFIRAADWIGVMVAWPFTAIAGLVGDLWRRSPKSFMDTAQGAFAEEGSGIEDMLARWLGGGLFASIVAGLVLVLLFGDTPTKGRR